VCREKAKSALFPIIDAQELDGTVAFVSPATTIDPAKGHIREQ
jgi:hypothetical protein